jgi:hypothetical protein
MPSGFDIIIFITAISFPMLQINTLTFRVKKENESWEQWLTSVILAIQEAEIRRFKVLNKPGQIVHETLY